MHMIIGVIKTLGLIMLLIWMLLVATKLFLRHTLLGKTIAVLFKGVKNSIKLCFRITKYTCVGFYKNSLKFYEFIDKQYKNYENKLNEKEISKVVNGDNNSNVIDLNSAKLLRHKWDE